jgi:adenylate cyclase, class 2
MVFLEQFALVSHKLGCNHYTFGKRGTAMLEIEVKYPVKDWTEIERKLHAWGASFDAPLMEADQYFNAPDRDFAQTDEALRLRQIGDNNFVTYKGPKIDSQTKTRTEIEVPLAPGDATAKDFARLLVHLKYRPVSIVRKQRIIAHLRREAFDMEVCLDDVDGLGKYIELEILAPPASLEGARQVLFKVAKDLGLETSERRSYLEMVLAKQG